MQTQPHAIQTTLEPLPEIADRVRTMVSNITLGEIVGALDEDRDNGTKTADLAAAEALDGAFKGFLWTLRAIGDRRKLFTAAYAEELRAELAAIEQRAAA